MDENQQLSSGHLQKIDFFDGIPREQVVYLLRDTTVESVQRRQNVFLEGDPADFLVLVLDGFFKLSKECEYGKRRMTLDFICAGEMVAGLLMVDPNARYIGTLETLEAGHVIKIPRTTYANYWSQYPEVLRRLQQSNLSRMRSLHHLREAGAFPLEKKLAWTVIKYLKRISHGEQMVEIKFSRKDLSELIGTTTESVIRVLSHWKAENMVVIRDDIEYFDSDELEKRYFQNRYPTPKAVYQFDAK